MTDFRALCAGLMDEAIYLGSLPYEQDPDPDLIVRARAALAQPEPQGPSRPAIEPVPVSERLPGPEDCDPSSQCWWFTPSEEKWIFWPIKWAGPECSHWLPHWALPVPPQEADQ